VIRVALLAVLCSVSQARAQTVDDNQVWMAAEGRADLTERARLSVEQELRLGSNAGYDQTHTDIELGYRISKALAVAGHYRLILLDGETRHRVAGDFSARLRRKPIQLTYRLRLQATSRPNDSTLVPIRNKVTVAVAAPHDLEPYAGFEIQYMIKPNAEYRERRIYIGVEWHASARIDLAAYFLDLRESNVNMPAAYEVLGVGLTYQFRDVGKGKGDRGDDAGHDAGPSD